MLNAIMAVFLLGAGLLSGSMITPANANLIAERVELVVEDPTRIDSATLILDELKTEVEDFNSIFIDSGDRLHDLYLEHGGDSSKARRSLEALNLEWYASQNRSVKLRDRLKESITADEWAVIFGVE